MEGSKFLSLACRLGLMTHRQPWQQLNFGQRKPWNGSRLPHHRKALVAWYIRIPAMFMRIQHLAFPLLVAWQ